MAISKTNYQAFVSNPVFMQLQTPKEFYADTKSVILYANKFSGLDEIPVSDPELMGLLIGDYVSLTDINLRLQLHHLFEEYDSLNGPWYIDGVNGILHIHNRKIASPSFVYRYQDENGEVLKVQVVTNWTTGSASGTVASAITPDKEYDNLKFSDFKPDLTVDPHETNLHTAGPVWLEVDNVATNADNYVPSIRIVENPDGSITYVGDDAAVSDYKSRGVNPRVQPQNLIGSPTPRKPGIRKIKEDLAQERSLNDIPKANARESASIKSLLDSWAVDSKDPNAEALDKVKDVIRKHIEKSSGQNIEVGKGRANAFDYLCEGGSFDKLPKDLQDFFNKNLYLEVPEFKDIIPRAKGIRKHKVESTRKRYTASQSDVFNHTHNSMPEGAVHQSFKTKEEALQWLKDHNYVTRYTNMRGQTVAIGPNVIMAKDLENMLTVSQANSSTPTMRKNINLDIDEDGKVVWSVISAGEYAPVLSAVDFTSYIYKRNKPGVGGSKKARAQAYLNAMRNRASKAKHKEIEVQMIVVGRPGLAAGQYIEIQNIGSKYSGVWYIKTCIHQMDSNGYTCSLTLKKNSPSTGSGLHYNKSKDSSNFSNLVSLTVDGKRTKLTYNDYGYVKEQQMLADAGVPGAAENAQRVIREAVYLQEQGKYQEGIKIPKQSGDIRTNGIESPDITWDDTPEGQAAREAIKAQDEAMRQQQKISKEAAKALSTKRSGIKNLVNKLKG